MIHVRGERVLCENRLERKRQSDQRKQEVKGVKRVEKNAQESQRGRQNRQNTARGAQKRARKGISKRRICSEEQREQENFKAAPEKNEKRSSTNRSKLQKIRERRGGRSCLIWVSSYAKAQKNSIFLYQSSFDFDSSFSLYFKSRFGKIMTWAFIAQKPSSRFIAPITLQSVRILQVISRRLECLIQSW